MRNTRVKRFNLDHVLGHDKILFNTNNHRKCLKPNSDDEAPKGYSEEQEMAPNYKETIEKGNTKNWIDFFHVGYQTVTLDKQDLTWMEKALEIGVNTRKFSHLFDDELAATCAKHTFPRGVWFVRTNRVSLKEGCHGVGPYTSLEKVIESMVSTNLGHCCFNHSDNDCVIYLLPWLEIHPDKEFRIFVYNNQITALSSQHLYSVNEWLNDKSEAEIDAIVQRILVFFEARVKQPMSYMNSYVMDLALVGKDETPYFIEPNSFGKHYAAGSALFHWIYDHDILHGDYDDEPEAIELRFVNEY